MELRSKYEEYYIKKIRYANENEKKYLKLLRNKIYEVQPIVKTNNSMNDIKSACANLEGKIASITSLKTNYINTYYDFLNYLKKTLATTYN